MLFQFLILAFWMLRKQETLMKFSFKKRGFILTGVLIVSIMACNLPNIGADSASIGATPSAQVSLSPTATMSGFMLTARAEEDTSSTKVSESTPTIVPPNVTASGLAVTQVNGYIDTFGSLQVVGLVENMTDRTVDMIEVEVQILDASGNEIYTDKTFTALDRLTPGEESPFSLTVYEDLGRAASSYIAYVVGNGTIDDLIRTDIQVINLQMSTDRDGDIYVTGELVNDNDYPVIVNSIAAATFDNTDQVLTANYQSVLMRYLDPGQSGYFRVSMSGLSSGPNTITDYSVYLDAEQIEPLEHAAITITTSNGYVDLYGGYHLVGEATNVGEVHYNVNLVAGIYDQHGNVIDAADLSLAQETLAPGETTPFDFTFWGPLNYEPNLVRTVESHNIVVDNAWTWSTETGMVNLSTLEKNRDDSDESIYFTGQLVNSSPEPVDSAVIIVFLRDSQSGAVMATNFDYDYEVLEPGATYDYQIEIPMWADFDIDSVVVNYIVKGTKP
jgi:hypothetical protein